MQGNILKIKTNCIRIPKNTAYGSLQTKSDTCVVVQIGLRIGYLSEMKSFKGSEIFWDNPFNKKSR